MLEFAARDGSVTQARSHKPGEAELCVLCAARPVNAEVIIHVVQHCEMKKLSRQFLEQAA